MATSIVAPADYVRQLAPFLDIIPNLPPVLLSRIAQHVIDRLDLLSIEDEDLEDETDCSGGEDDFDPARHWRNVDEDLQPVWATEMGREYRDAARVRLGLAA